jgi:hypothetical protein
MSDGGHFFGPFWIRRDPEAHAWAVLDDYGHASEARTVDARQTNRSNNNSLSIQKPESFTKEELRAAGTDCEHDEIWISAGPAAVRPMKQATARKFKVIL